MNRGTNVQNNPPSRVVYLGSIPYDQTEEQLLDLCRNVGPVVNLKLMFDPQTGKSKGYAFVEYKDLETSASAVRNLNGYPIGSRFLKCGYSSNSDIGSGGGNDLIGNDQDFGNNNGSSNGNSSNTFLRFPELPSGIDVNINMTTPAMMISSELSKKSPEEQLEILSKFQDWSKENLDDAIALLEECPQLVISFAEMLLTNGISKTDDLLPLAVQSNTNSNDQNQNESDKDPKLQEKQKNLLKQVLQLSDSEISILPDDERMAIWDIKQKAMKGEYGMI
ncbi:hypothetical protein Kpol_1026p16 [Vanderwaltozyma polyspora DSM 70294]|uniref:RRM domain-containing protein n=1 Tax=Vanderwaltozyma polyspora (strain ATCC 22028 / DSM 70294 / BCRC 21397 / CBS 2163 / NBRC 10782 / NRRL Y-8283 / UCD 57-17) TaxID=436907 RepID=A7TNI6_VANPO|nr:uncharacterized protein Kpol_1026p16 [Vanderwaltozyma polyspora DSM 70294]EDO16169.1 hypothetical protein Kpol_1026p16 [Vanderwaltozyma polyspora DSM 70294]